MIRRDGVTIEIANTTRQRLPLAFLRRAAEIAIKELGIRDAAVTVVLVGERRMATLNRRFRDKSGATNVLAFPYDQGDGPMRGDVVLCLPVIKKEAKSLSREHRGYLAALLVHGIVHIAGYTHETEKNAIEMERIEERIARRLRLTNDQRLTTND